MSKDYALAVLFLIVAYSWWELSGLSRSVSLGGFLLGGESIRTDHPGSLDAIWPGLLNDKESLSLAIAALSGRNLWEGTLGQYYVLWLVLRLFSFRRIMMIQNDASLSQLD